MTQVIKKGGKRQAFSPKKIRESIKRSAKEAGLSASKINEVVKKAGDSTIDFYRKKKTIRSTELRRSILRKLDRTAKSVSSAWRRFEKKKK